MSDHFNALDTFSTNFGEYYYYRLFKLEEDGITNLSKLPISIRILLEGVLRQCNGKDITQQDVKDLANWKPKLDSRNPMPFKPGRVVMQDFTGVPAVVDLTAMRSAMSRLGGDPTKINPVIPVDLVIDHSVQVDFFSSDDAVERNVEMEFVRNRERYEFLHWGQKAFENFKVIPPNTGIIHQVNLEFLSKSVLKKEIDGKTVVFPDSLVGTDSHTTMINGLGVVGWGVGGIEAEAAILGQAIDMLTPDVIGFKLKGKLKEGITPTDLTLTITQMLRKYGVVGKFIEFYGEGLNAMSLADRAMIANMTPENGGTMTFFPVDEETLNYLRLTGRTEEEVELASAYYKAQGLFRTDDMPDPEFTDFLELDMSTVVASLSGPKRPHDRVNLDDMQSEFQKVLVTSVDERGFGLSKEELNVETTFGSNGNAMTLKHGALVIAAITSCTNTSNPSVMIGAGLVAKKALKKGLKVKPYVKTSLAPGSRVVTEYLEDADLLQPLADQGFNLVGYGCTTCIGNSGPLAGEVVKAITSNKIITSSVSSGNRNFEGRIHPYSLANYLASPPLVVAYALAGTVDIDLSKDSLGDDTEGNPVYLKDIWPTAKEINDTLNISVKAEMFIEKYAGAYNSNETWNEIKGGDKEVYEWSDKSTYIQEPPFFIEMTTDVDDINNIIGARVLALLGDSITTDHISPAGAIPMDSPAATYLKNRDISPSYFNSYGSRRGNDKIMTRGTFGNIRLKNKLVAGKEGGYTVYHPTGEQMSMYEAAEKYKEDNTPLIILTGKEYGSGSSRDWAAKGTLLLGVKAVIAESYERIHRSNLLGMGVLPLQFLTGESAESHGLDGSESIDITELHNDISPNSTLSVTATKKSGVEVQFNVKTRLDTPMDIEYYQNGGILHAVLRDRLQNKG